MKLARPDLRNWVEVRRWEAATRQQLRRRHALWLHGWAIGLVVLAFMWAAAHLQMLAGVSSLALRYLVTLGIGYLGFLLVLRWWAGALVGEETSLDAAEAVVDNLPVDAGPVDAAADAAGEVMSALRPGGGGDFVGAGAQGDFGMSEAVSALAEKAGGAVSSLADNVPDAASALAESVDVGGALGDVAGGALEAVGEVVADEDVVKVVIPVVAIFIIGFLLVLGFGSLLLLYFGWEVLLSVAVELAFGYASARTAVRVAREGWLGAAVRLTWKPLLGAIGCAVLLGGAVDWFVPGARSLPDAMRILWQAL